MKYFHTETKKQVIFGKWINENLACCLTPQKKFKNLTREELDNSYVSYSTIEKEAREKRKGQCW